MKLAEKLLIFFALVVVAMNIAPLARSCWFDAFVNDRTFTTSFAWLDIAEAILWSFELIFYFIFGAIVGVLFRPNAAIWAISFGCVCGALHLLLSRNNFMPQVSWTLYFWVYGNDFMPIIGAVAGAAASQWMINHLRGRSVRAGLR